MLNRYSDEKQLTWFIRLRWAAISGQTILLIVATCLLKISVPTFYLWGIIFLITITNVGLQFYNIYQKPVTNALIGTTLVTDTLLLTVILALTGGPANPFSIVYLLHVSIAAILLGSFWTWVMVAFSTSCFAVLFKYNLIVPELSMHHHSSSESLSVHLYGMLLAFSTVAVISGYFLTKMSESLKAQEREIGNLKLIAAHHERLTALTTLSAGAAHELNTPMATIALAASELKAALQASQASKDMIEDTQLILNQIDRCRIILEDMSAQTGDTTGEVPQRISYEELVLDIQSQNVGLHASKLIFKPTAVKDFYAPKNGLLRSLLILIGNGIDAGDENNQIHITIDKIGSSVEFRITDHGKGIPDDVLKRVGDPFFTTKEPGKGMGLGVFLVKLFASQLGGSLDITSQCGKGTAAILRVPQPI